MSESAKSALMKVVAVLVLAVAAWILLRIVINVVAFLAWIIAGLIAIVAIVWAVNTLRSSPET